ncbi:MAG TPA: hypothetical protein VHE35_21160 [Kofleriaceae bacterium]|nr:hypothetical protein [Kofleriaceae bacterium]
MPTEQAPTSRQPTGWISVLTDAVTRAFRRHPGRTGVPAVTINRTAEDVFLMLRKVERIPMLCDALEAVDTRGPTLSHWVMRSPTGGRREWDVEITGTVPEKLIEWRATAGKRHVTGAVTLSRAPAREMTEVRVEIDRDDQSDPGLVARIFAAPFILEALRRLKQVLETGEVLHSDASIHARPHPAQPSNGGAS